MGEVRPARSDAARRRVRWMAVAAALVTGVLALVLLLVLMTASEVSLPELGDPPAGGERPTAVSAPPPDVEQGSAAATPREGSPEPVDSR